MAGADHIIERLESAFRGPAWHGPSLVEALAGVTAEIAARRSVAGGHSIHELVVHLTVWKRAPAVRLSGEAWMPTPEEDWPPVRTWESDLAALHEAHAALIAAVHVFDDARLGETAPAAEGHSYASMLQGCALHDVYHAGQISLLKK
jgi:uncharacterized damage-inducible protein DinB